MHTYGGSSPSLDPSDDIPQVDRSSTAISAQSRASSQTAHHNYHGEEHVPVAKLDGMSIIKSTYSFVSPPLCATVRAKGSEAERSVGGGKGSHVPKFKLSFSAPPPKPKPKTRPQTAQRAVCRLRFLQFSYWYRYHILISSLSFFRYILAAGVLEILAILYRIYRLQRPINATRRHKASGT